MNLLSKFLLVASVLLITYSCSVNKRIYRPGYNIDWLVHKSAPRKISRASDNASAGLSKTEENVILSYSSQELKNLLPAVLLASNSKTPFIVGKRTSAGKVWTKKNDSDSTKCDIIILKNGEEIKGKVFEISSTEIRYKDCEYPDGPIYVKKASTVFMIRYPNGTKTLISSTEVNSAPDKIYIKRTSDKSQLIALILCVVVGTFGIHRFYLGDIPMGVLYLLTMGFCGIGVIIDIILILTDSLKPRDGEYQEKI